MFIFAFIFSNLNKTFQITTYINLFKNIIVSLPALVCIFNYKLIIKNKALIFLLLVFCPLILFGFVGIYKLISIYILIIFAFFLSFLFHEDFLFNYGIIKRLKNFLAFFIYFYLIIFVIDIFMFDNDNIKIISNEFYDDSQSGITNFNLGNILLNFQYLFKYSKYFDLTIFAVIFLIYNSYGIKLIKSNKFLITAILIFFILQGNTISVIIYIFFLFLIIFLNYKQKIKNFYIITFLTIVFILIASVVDILSYNGFIKYKSNQYNYNNNNFALKDNVHPIFSKTIIISKIDKLASHRLQRWVAPCSFLEKRYSQFPYINHQNELSKLSFQYKCAYSGDEKKILSDNFLNYQIKPKFYYGSFLDKISRNFSLDNGWFESLYLFGFLWFCFLIFINLKIIISSFYNNKNDFVILTVIFIYFFLETGIHSTGNIFAIIYYVLIFKTVKEKKIYNDFNYSMFKE